MTAGFRPASIYVTWYPAIARAGETLVQNVTGLDSDQSERLGFRRASRAADAIANTARDVGSGTGVKTKKPGCTRFDTNVVDEDPSELSSRISPWFGFSELKLVPETP